MGGNPFRGFFARPLQKAPQIFENFLSVNFPEQRSSGESFGFSFRKDPGGNIIQDLPVRVDLIEPKRAGDLFYGLPVKAEEKVMNDRASFQGLEAQDFFGSRKAPKPQNRGKKISKRAGSISFQPGWRENLPREGEPFAKEVKGLGRVETTVVLGKYSKAPAEPGQVFGPLQNGEKAF
jgi:hypothetical protein